MPYCDGPSPRWAFPPQEEEQAKWEAQRDAEVAKMRRDRRVLEKQSKALLKLPNKKERTAMEGALGPGRHSSYMLQPMRPMSRPAAQENLG